jgi:hypothetical protein
MLTASCCQQFKETGLNQTELLQTSIKSLSETNIKWTTNVDSIKRSSAARIFVFCVLCSKSTVVYYALRFEAQEVKMCRRSKETVSVLKSRPESQQRVFGKQFTDTSSAMKTSGAKRSKIVSDTGFVRECLQDRERSSYQYCNKIRNIALTVASINDIYMFRLQSNHHQAVYTISKNGNYIPVADI